MSAERDVHRAIETTAKDALLPGPGPPIEPIARIAKVGCHVRVPIRRKLKPGWV